MTDDQAVYVHLEDGPGRYRIEFTITRQQDGEDDYAEIGFGSSGAWASVEAAAYNVMTALQRGEWETTPGMPDPAEVLLRD